jgi:hypothetical protein
MKSVIYLRRDGLRFARFQKGFDTFITGLSSLSRGSNSRSRLLLTDMSLGHLQIWMGRLMKMVKLLMKEN